MNENDNFVGTEMDNLVGTEMAVSENDGVSTEVNDTQVDADVSSAQSSESEKSRKGELTDEEFEAEAKRRTDPSEHEVEGGLDVIPAWIMLLCSAIALIASAALELATLEHAKAPGVELSCDINSYISCGASLDSWKSAVFFSIPNSLIGVMAFSALLTISVLLISCIKLPRWLWLAMSVVSTLGLLFVYWFAWESAFSFQKLCPWCMVVWACVIPLFIIIAGRAARAQIPGLGWLGRTMVRDWWGYLAIMYGLIVLIVILGLGTQLFS